MQAASAAAAWTLFFRLINFADSQTRAYALHCLLTQAVCSLLTRTKNKCLLRSRLFCLSYFSCIHLTNPRFRALPPVAQAVRSLTSI